MKYKVILELSSGKYCNTIPRKNDTTSKECRFRSDGIGFNNWCELFDTQLKPKMLSKGGIVSSKCKKCLNLKPEIKDGK